MCVYVCVYMCTCVCLFEKSIDIAEWLGYIFYFFYCLLCVQLEQSSQQLRFPTHLTPALRRRDGKEVCHLEVIITVFDSHDNCDSV